MNSNMTKLASKSFAFIESRGSVAFKITCEKIIAWFGFQIATAIDFQANVTVCCCILWVFILPLLFDMFPCFGFSQGIGRFSVQLSLLATRVFAALDRRSDPEGASAESDRALQRFLLCESPRRNGHAAPLQRWPREQPKNHLRGDYGKWRKRRIRK